MAVSRLRRYRSITVILGLLAVALLVAGAASSIAAQTTPSPRAHFDSAFPDAEVIDVVSEDNSGTVTETWVDQTTGDVLKKATDKNGKLREAILRRGLTISTYVVTDRNTGVNVRQVLSKDDLALTAATAHLDQFRSGIERGALANLGQEVFNGQPAIKAAAAGGRRCGNDHLPCP